MPPKLPKVLRMLLSYHFDLAPYHNFIACSLLVHLYRVSNVALRHMNKQV